MTAKPKTTLYVPTLRLKAGEILGVSNLRDDIKDLIRPHFIAQPRKERDSKIFDLFSKIESMPDTERVISKFWKKRPVLINPKFLYNDFGEAKCSTWMPAIFDTARGDNVYAVPVVTLTDLESIRFAGIIGSVDTSSILKIALVIEQRDLVDSELRSRILSAMDRLKIETKACSILIDYSETDFENPDIVSAIIEGTYEDIQAIGDWESIVFQGTSFPRKNPANHKSSVLLPRNEWIAWKKAVDFSPSTPNQFVFGDFAADNAIMRFGKCQVQAIRHYRYALSEKWLVVRAPEFGKDLQRMAWVANNVVESGHFAGRTFSSADEIIYRTAKEGIGPKTAKDWRAINTTHHITRVVSDIGKVKGLAFEQVAVPKTEEQFELL